MNLPQLQELLRPLASRVTNMVARIVVGRVDDSKKLQTVQLGALADLDDGEHHQPYGFSSVPLVGAEGVAVFPNGDAGVPLVVVISDRRHRPTDGEPGEVTVYNHTGATMRFTKDGDVKVKPAPGRKVIVEATDGSAGELATKADLVALRDAFVSWVVAAGDGGLSLKTVLTDLITENWPSGTSVLKAE
jgi:phage baseplate assembly protein V